MPTPFAMLASRCQMASAGAWPDDGKAPAKFDQPFVVTFEIWNAESFEYKGDRSYLTPATTPSFPFTIVNWLSSRVSSSSLLH